MTYNVGGAKIDYYPKPHDILDAIREQSPDILAIQECVDWMDADGNEHYLSKTIAQVGNYGLNYSFGRTLSMKEHLQIKKAVMVEAIFDDLQGWAQGNAIFSRCGFTRLGDTNKPGFPRNIPIFLPPVYQGNRDTDPRYALLARINLEPLYPFVVNVHLTTLMGERGKGESRIPGKRSEAQELRITQTRRLMELLRPAMEENRIIVLLGDFNASVDEPSLSVVIEDEGGFTRLVPEIEKPTHINASSIIDHIYIYPQDCFGDYKCWIAENEITYKASDHLPVVAEVDFFL